MESQKFISPDVVEADYGLKKSTQQNLRAARKITYVKIGGRVAYLREWVEAYIEKTKVVSI